MCNGGGIGRDYRRAGTGFGCNCGGIGRDYRRAGTRFRCNCGGIGRDYRRAGTGFRCNGDRVIEHVHLKMRILMMKTTDLSNWS